MNLDKSIIVQVFSEELCRAVQDKFFELGVPWSGGSRVYYDRLWEDRGPEGCIRYEPTPWRNDRQGHLRCGTVEFYTDGVEFRNTPIIPATEFLGQVHGQVMFVPMEVK